MSKNLTNIYPETGILELYKNYSYWYETNAGKLLDIHLGSTCFIFGFTPQSIVDKITEMQHHVGFVNPKHNERFEFNDRLRDKICKIGGFEGLSWAVSGSDGVENALAMNDDYWQIVDPKKKKIVSFSPGYHGTTFLTRALIEKNLLPEKIKIIDLAAWDNIANREDCEAISIARLKEFLVNHHESVGAIVMESIPWANSLRPWSALWWQQIRQLCDQYNINFIVDDVAGGCGKLGNIFSHQRYGVQPDIVVLGKALTNGMCPLSCACAVKRIIDTVYSSWWYGHTWQPVQAGMAAADYVIDNLCPDQINAIESRIGQIGKRLLENNLINNYHNIGLFFYIKLLDPIDADTFVKNGISNRIPISEESVYICVPYIADDEYFFELETRLTKVINDGKNQ